MLNSFKFPNKDKVSFRFIYRKLYICRLNRILNPKIKSIMGSLSSLYIKTETLETILNTLKKRGEKGIELTVSLSDDVNQFGQNLTSYVSQSKEDRDAKKDRYYVGNGKCFWTDGKITKAEKQQSNNEPTPNGKYDNASDDEAPF